MQRFNDWLGLRITNMVATMWCAYIFMGLAIYGFPYGDKNPKDIVQWFAQTFLQLVLLSIILVGQKLQSDKHDKLVAQANAKHKEVVRHLKRIHSSLGIEDKE